MSAKKASRLSKRKYTTIQDAAQYLSVSTKTIRRMIESGEITGYKIGTRGVRVLISEIEERVVREMPSAANNWGERR